MQCWKIREHGCFDKWQFPFEGKTAEDAAKNWAKWHDKGDDGCHLANGGELDIEVALMSIESDDRGVCFTVSAQSAIDVTLVRFDPEEES